MPSRLSELLGVLLADVASDVEVVARELRLGDEMRKRLQRALDRVERARDVPEAMRDGVCWREALAVEYDGGTVAHDGRGDAEGNGRCVGGRIVGDEVTEMVVQLTRARLWKQRFWRQWELVAEGWPQDYSEGAVEWLVIKEQWPPEVDAAN